MQYVTNFDEFMNEAEGRDTLGELNEMTLGQLERIADYANMIKDRMTKGEQLESWMYSQLTTCLDNLNAVHDAMDGNDGKIESVKEDKVYIDFLNKKKGFSQDRIKFNSYEEAVKWAKKNFDKFDPDMIKYESLTEAKPGPDPYMTGLSDKTEDKKKDQMKKQAAMSDDDDAAYKDMPGDKEAREKGKVKTSKHTKSYHDLYGESIDEAEEQSTDRSPIDDDAIETGLKNKADETGVPIGIIRAVMRRGIAAWKTGHRPGTTSQQWGYARCNSFLTGQPGTWGGADKDLAKEARKAGFNPKK